MNSKRTFLEYEGIRKGKTKCYMEILHPKISHPDGPVTVIILTEWENNKNTCITNLIGHICWKAHIAAGQPYPCVFIECQETPQTQHSSYSRMYTIINFPQSDGNFEIEYIGLQGYARLTFKKPECEHIAENEFETLFEETAP